jgi:phosphatidate cytidylyltransferase
LLTVLRERLLTAAIGIPVLLAVVLLGGPWFAAVLALFLAAGTLELSRAAGVEPRRPEALAAALIAAAFVPADYGNADLANGLVVAAVVVPLLAATFRAETGAPATMINATTVTPEAEAERAPPPLPLWLVLMAATLYAGWLGHYLLLVRRLDLGVRWFLVLLLGAFATDTGAFAVGRLLGRHKMAPRVSPAKTWEGAAGGLIAAIAAVCALIALLALPGQPWQAALLGLLVGVAAEIGDLAESLIKRRLRIKDMSRLIPGHGGVLDRLDSLLFVGPVLYFFVRWVILR